MTKRFVLDFVGGRRSSAFLKLGAVLLLAVLSSVAALAQLAGKGAVSGTVLDPTVAQWFRVQRSSSRAQRQAL
jgi:hypothetical protein